MCIIIGLVLVYLCWWAYCCYAAGNYTTAIIDNNNEQNTYKSREPTFHWRSFQRFKAQLVAKSAQQFKRQPQETWLKFRAATRFLNESTMPLQPSCVLLVGSGAKMTDCMSKQVAQAFVQATDTPFLIGWWIFCLILCYVKVVFVFHIS